MFTAIMIAAILPAVSAERYYEGFAGEMTTYVHLKVPATPLDVDDAMVLLHGSWEPDVYHVAALRAAGVKVGVISPNSTNIYFRGAPEYQADLAFVRRMVAKYAECPELEHAQKFPRPSDLNVVVASIAQYRLRLNHQRKDFMDFSDEFDAEDARAAWFERLYTEAASGTRPGLQYVRDSLTEEEWAMGLLPLWIPQAGVR